MSLTLVIAEKPSVGRDLVAVLPGAFTKHEGYLEGPEHVVTWAVGHLVQLADPDEYDDRFKKWRMADLPIVPDRFKLVVRDERSKKQMNVVKRLLDRDDVDHVVNACDAGREGELIFAYLYEKAGSKKPVQRLWLNSMTKDAIRDAFGDLRPGADLASLEAAARSRSEADWIVGMNATRAATIRLRSSFDGAVSLGRVQTPTLAILARREQEIRDFKPEPYWVVDAVLDPVEDRPRTYEGRYHAGANPRIATASEATAIVEACRGQTGEITKLEKSERKERPQLLYDLTSLQRDANRRYGFTARRTLAAAQRLYEEHKALTYPRTNSRFLTGDMIPEIKPIARLLGQQPDYAKASEYVLGLDVLPLGRVVNDAKVTDHHAIIPTRAERHPVDKMSDDDRKIYDLVVRRFLAIFHPDAVFENTRVETTVAEHVFRTRGKVMLVAGWRAVYGELPDGRRSFRRRRGPRAAAAQAGARGAGRRHGGRLRGEGDQAAARATTTASLARRDGDRRQARRRRRAARGDEGVRDRHAGDPRGDHRAADPGRLRRARRPRVRGHREGPQRDPPARRARADLARPDRRLGAPAGADRDRRRLARGVHGRHRPLYREHGRRARSEFEGRADSAGEPRPVPGVRSRHRREPQGLLVLGARGPGLRVRDLEVEGRQVAPDRRSPAS